VTSTRSVSRVVSQRSFDELEAPHSHTERQHDQQDEFAEFGPHPLKNVAIIASGTTPTPAMNNPRNSQILPTGCR